MPRAHWLTPDAPADGFICRRLLVPNSVEFLALVTGALLSLQEQYNWETFGALTPAQTTAYFRTMVDDFSLPNERTCRVIGEIIAFAGLISPDPNWLLCEGQSLARVDYPDLFTVIGTTYGALDSDHFNLPDLQGRTVIGQGSGSGLTPRSVGDSGGEETHVLSVSELANHGHSDTGHSHIEGTATASVVTVGAGAPAPTAIPSAGVTANGSANITATGSDSPHNTMQPYLTICYLIVAL